MTGERSTVDPRAPGQASVAQRWLARLALAAVVAAAVLLLVEARDGGLPLIAVAAGGLVLTAAGLWWTVRYRGPRRLLALALLVLAPITVLVLFVLASLVWVVGVSLGLMAVAVGSGRAALRRDPGPTPMPEHEAPSPRRAFVIMNPRSGGGKVAKFDLERKARALNAEVALLEGPGTVDVAELARKAVADGADLLGVAGGDGTQALVAAVAAEHGVPLLVISAGTRNHFALDLGLDRDDPSRCLAALADGVELHVDLGWIGDQPFVNNVSFGAYATVVQSPAYRADKTRTTLDLLPEALAGHRGARLRARAGNLTIDGPQAVLVSNNPYGMGDVAGLGRRARLDGGVLGLVGVRVGSAMQAAGLLRGRHGHGLAMAVAGEVVVEADAPSIPVGVDGEALSLATPVRCTVRPKALRVRVPRDRPGVPLPKPPMNWRRLGRMAMSTGRGHRDLIHSGRWRAAASRLPWHRQSLVTGEGAWTGCPTLRV